jgi:hypothetical protein
VAIRVLITNGLHVGSHHLAAVVRHEINVSRSDECPQWVAGSTDRRNTLTFLRRWSVGHEAASADLLFGGSTD